ENWVEPRSFLFLRMARLEVSDHRTNPPRRLAWHKGPAAGGAPAGVERLTCEADAVGGRAPPRHEFLRWTSSFQLGEERPALPRLDAKARALLPEDCPVKLIVPLQEGAVAPPVRPQGDLFNGLPVRAVDTGLHFHVNAPFNLTGARDNILGDSFD